MEEITCYFQYHLLVIDIKLLYLYVITSILYYSLMGINKIVPVVMECCMIFFEKFSKRVIDHSVSSLILYIFSYIRKKFKMRIIWSTNDTFFLLLAICTWCMQNLTVNHNQILLQILKSIH